MSDTYNSFKSLSETEKEGKDFKICFKKTNSKIAVIAPHGGEIEPGTSEIAKSIAGEDFTYYSFEGIKKEENKKYLHITSTKFDEPICTLICARAETVLAIHGAIGDDHTVYVGGLGNDLREKIIDKLKWAGFNAKEDKTNHSGRDANNICNKGISRKGIQLEISNGLRKQMFMGLRREERLVTSEIFNAFVESVKSVLHECGLSGT